MTWATVGSQERERQREDRPGVTARAAVRPPPASVGLRLSYPEIVFLPGRLPEDLERPRPADFSALDSDWAPHSPGVRRVELAPATDGAPRYVLHYLDGRVARVSPLLVPGPR